MDFTAHLELLRGFSLKSLISCSSRLLPDKYVL
uniref:Uncharacterized protein n=1 Tax=Arundo donax TaxID=35708 RepID=A0A0A8ZUY8_ARUDO